MMSRQEAVTEQSNASMRSDCSAALKNDISRHVLIGTSKSIIDPGARAGVAKKREACVEGEISLCMLIERGGHGTDDRQIISAPLLHLREHGADFKSTLTTTLKRKRAGKDVPIVVELGSFNAHWHGLPRQTLQGGFGVQAIQMREAPGHVTKDDMPCLGRMVRGAERRAILGLEGAQPSQRHEPES